MVFCYWPGWSWSRVGRYRNVVCAWNFFTSSMKSCSFFYFPNVYIYPQNFKRFSWNHRLIVLLVLQFCFSNYFFSQLKFIVWNPSITPKIHRNTAFWCVKMTLHDETATWKRFSTTTKSSITLCFQILWENGIAKINRLELFLNPKNVIYIDKIIFIYF